MAEVFGTLGILFMLLSVVCACLEHDTEAAIGAGFTVACFAAAFLLDPILSPIL